MIKGNVLKRCLFITILVIILLLVVCIMLRYEVEGEKELPFNIKKILVVSTVDGQRVDDEENIWNIDLKQDNDIYMYIEKTEKHDDEFIKQITFDNFCVNVTPNKGDIKIYRPTGELENLYVYSEQDYLDSEIKYVGEKIDDLKSLEINSSGGMAGFRISLEDIGKFISNEGDEIAYDGTLLKNIDITDEDIKTNISFDVVIETNENIKFKGTYNLNLPQGNIIEEGSSNFEITNFDDVIFKRI